MYTGLVHDPLRVRPRRSLQETRQLLERLVTVAAPAQIIDLEPEYFRPASTDDGAAEWYAQFGDATRYWEGRAELLQMVFELFRTSRAPAVRVLNARAWFEEWVELPQPALGFRSPAELCCTTTGLEATKVILRSLQARASE